MLVHKYNFLLQIFSKINAILLTILLQKKICPSCEFLVVFGQLRV